MNTYSSALQLVWDIAAIETANAQYEFIEPEFLFLGLCKLDYFSSTERMVKWGVKETDFASTQAEIELLFQLFTRFHLDPVRERREIRQHMGIGTIKMSDRPDKMIHRSPASRDIFLRAGELAQKGDAPIIATFHLLAALLDDEPTGISDWLAQKNIDAEQLKKAAFAYSLLEKDSPQEKKTPDHNILERYGKDLTQLAREGKIQSVIGRKEEMLQIVRTLSRATKNNPVLIGEAGVGKTAIVEGLAWRIAQGNVPDVIKEKRIIQISLADLVAGTKYRGEFEERMQALVRQVAAAPQVILFIDEIHTIIGAGDVAGGMDAANILKPSLARGEFRCIGATTIDEYHKHIEKDAALERRFQPITVEESTPQETLDILHGLQSHLEQRHDVIIAEEGCQAAVSLTVRYLPNRRLPDKAIDLLDEACARVQIERLSVAPDQPSLQRDEQIVTASVVAQVLAQWTGIPVTQLTEDERLRLSRMSIILKQRVIGQDQAVDNVAQAIQRARVGLRSTSRPMSVLLFLGPTGVGKTELAKATAEFLFGSEQALLRFDMSEYMEKHTVSRLIGSPPGYVGYEEEGQFSRALRRKPFAVVLLDEIEKAHPDVLNLFLQVFDDGRLTDAQGHLIDATNALFIMTSNLQLPRAIGFSNIQASDPQTLSSYLSKILRPELINRIDNVVVFQTLQPSHITEICNLLLIKLSDRMAEQGINLQFSDSAVSLVANLGYDAQFGARALRRTIEQQVEKPLSDMILGGQVHHGVTVFVDTLDGTLLMNILNSD